MGKECLNIKENKKRCSCEEIDCSRHGICCECVYYHRTNGGKPACLR